MIQAVKSHWSQHFGMGSSVSRPPSKLSCQSKIVSGRGKRRYNDAQNQLCIHPICAFIWHKNAVTNVILQINIYANCSKVLSKQIQRNRIHFVRSTLMIKKISQLGSYLSQFLSSLLSPSSHHLYPVRWPAWYFAWHPNQNQPSQTNKTSETEIWYWEFGILFALLVYPNLNLSVVFPKAMKNGLISILNFSDQIFLPKPTPIL